MSLSLDQIKHPIREEMDVFETKFRKAMQSSVPLLDRIMHYIVKRKGKQMRPMFVFLSAGTIGSIGESTYRAASLIELLHTATLVHDDVVDDSNLRRGFFSINALWKNKIAVLVGDYLLSRGLLLSVDHSEFDLLRIVSTAVRKMSEGELLQIEKARKLDITEEVYYEIITAKTASLIASCCATGAASVGADAEMIKRMHDFGEAVGIAFQIKDDLFDYEQTEQTGKPRGIDIKEHKMTLPLIYALQQADKTGKRFMMATVKSYSEDKERVEKVIRMVMELGGLDYARRQMQAYQTKAFGLLEGLPESPYKTSLVNLVRFTTERNH
ncbi:MAG: polyprenyl synthetase family protein [Bacteroidia bacterium]